MIKRMGFVSNSSSSSFVVSTVGIEVKKESLYQMKKVSSDCKCHLDTDINFCSVCGKKLGQFHEERVYLHPELENINNYCADVIFEGRLDTEYDHEDDTILIGASISSRDTLPAITKAFEKADKNFKEIYGETKIELFNVKEEDIRLYINGGEYYDC